MTELVEDYDNSVAVIPISEGLVPVENLSSWINAINGRAYKLNVELSVRTDYSLKVPKT